MIDITKEEFWENNHEEVTKVENNKSKLKEFISKNKIITTLIIGLGIIMTANTILIYNFFKILLNI